MYFVYIIQSEKYKKLYIGFTENLGERIKNHNEGKSLSTKSYKPWCIVYYEAYKSKKDALRRELKLKKFKNSYTRLKQRIQNCFL